MNRANILFVVAVCLLVAPVFTLPASIEEETKAPASPESPASPEVTETKNRSDNEVNSELGPEINGSPEIIPKVGTDDKVVTDDKAVTDDKVVPGDRVVPDQKVPDGQVGPVVPFNPEIEPEVVPTEDSKKPEIIGQSSGLFSRGTDKGECKFNS